MHTLHYTPPPSNSILYASLVTHVHMLPFMSWTPYMNLFFLCFSLGDRPPGKE